MARLWARIKSDFLKNGVGITVSTDSAGESEIKLRGSATNNITVGPEQNRIVGDTLFKDGELTMDNQYGSLCISPRLQKAFDISGMVPAVGTRYVLSAVELDTFKMTPEMIMDLVEQGSVRLSDGNVSAYATITLNGTENIQQLIFSINFDRKSTVEMTLEYLDGNETPVEGVVAHGLNYGLASETGDGLMSKGDKKRLDVLHAASAVKSVYFNESYSDGVELGVTRINPNDSDNDIEEYVQIPNATPTTGGVMSEMDKTKLDRFVLGPVLVTAMGAIDILNSQPNASFRQIVATAAKVKEAKVIYRDTNGNAAATYIYMRCWQKRGNIPDATRWWYRCDVQGCKQPPRNNIG